MMPLSFPVIDGREASGVVDEVGPGVSDAATDDEVFGFSIGGAAARGARVISTASEANHEFLRSLGAEPTTYGDGMVDRVRALAPDGIDLAFDTAGKGGIPDVVTLTGDPARVATIADFGAALGVKVIGAPTGARRAPSRKRPAWPRPGVCACRSSRRHFAQASEAHHLSHGGHVRGKLVLVPG